MVHLRFRITRQMQDGMITGHRLSGILRELGFPRADVYIKAMVNHGILVGERISGKKVGGYRAGPAWEEGSGFQKTSSTRVTSSPLAARIAQLEQEIKSEAGLDEELKAAQARMEELQARIKDRKDKEERLKQIKALLE